MKNLLKLQDGLNIAKNLIAAVFLVYERSLHPDGDERGAVGTVANAAREKLDAIDKDSKGAT